MSDAARAFFRNDLDYAPFGLRALIGVTPARIALVFLVCVLSVISGLSFTFPMYGISSRSVLLLGRLTGAAFAALIPMTLFLIWADRATRGAPLKRRVAWFSCALLGGASAFSGIRYVVHVHAFGMPHPWVGLAFGLVFSALLGSLLAVILVLVSRQRDASRALLRSTLARVSAERRIAEARLQLLRAQIEPHFLFNSLASIKRLYENDATGGRRMLRDLGTYLRAAIAPRGAEVPLADEVERALAFLGIFRERMGERLRTRVDVPADLRSAAIPPLMIGTLVENAIKHGIGPVGAGGSVEIVARREGGSLSVEVADDGRGFHDESGTGVGLANTRARLEMLYGDQADLGLRRNAAGGVTASLRIPLRKSVQTSLATACDENAAQSDAQTTSRKDARFLDRFLHILDWRHLACACCVGVLLGLLGLAKFREQEVFGVLWLESTMIGIGFACLFMLAIVAAEASAPAGRSPSLVRYLLACLGAASICAAIGYHLDITDILTTEGIARGDGRRAAQLMANPAYNARVHVLLRYSVPPIYLCILGTFIYVWLRRASHASEALARAEIERMEVERRLVASELDAAEAEADPSFVFRTLELIESAYERDREAGDAMLDELIAFLRAAIPKMRAEEYREARAPAEAMA